MDNSISDFSKSVHPPVNNDNKVSNLADRVSINQDNIQENIQEKKVLPIAEWAPKINEKRALQEEEDARANPEENKKKNYCKELKRLMPPETWVSWGPHIKDLRYDESLKKLFIDVTRGQSDFYKDYMIKECFDYLKKAAAQFYGEKTTIWVEREISI